MRRLHAATARCATSCRATPRFAPLLSAAPSPHAAVSTWASAHARRATPSGDSEVTKSEAVVATAAFVGALETTLQVGDASLVKPVGSFQAPGNRPDAIDPPPETFFTTVTLDTRSLAGAARSNFEQLIAPVVDAAKHQWIDSEPMKRFLNSSLCSCTGEAE